MKTNSTNHNRNGNNVALNLNIPASVSGFLLEEIDLKYVKKSRQKSKNNKMSNLLIKYFTNRSSNLHLSSVTKESANMPDYYRQGDLKERRDEDYPLQNREQGDHNEEAFDRPFRYRHKYPLRLLEKIRSSTKQRNKQREGKYIEDESKVENTFVDYAADDDLRPKRSSEEQNDEGLSEDDLLALESILTSKTVKVNSKSQSQISVVPQSNIDEDVSVEQLYDLFDHAINKTTPKKSITEIAYHDFKGTEVNTKPTTNRYPEHLTQKSNQPQRIIDNKKTNDGGNWFTRNLSDYFLSVVPMSLQYSMFGGASNYRRHKRSLNNYYESSRIYKDEPYKKTDSTFIKRWVLSNDKKSPFFPATVFSDPRVKKAQISKPPHHVDEPDRFNGGEIFRL